MKVVTSAQMRSIDARAETEFGLPRGVLMEAAGIAFARACREEIGGPVRGRGIAMLCGTGNNGGDGFVAARHLSNDGADVTLFLAGLPSDLRGDAALHFKPLTVAGLPIHASGTDGDAPDLFRFDLIGDALLGTGAKGAPRGAVAALVRAIRAAERVPVVSADIPSGVDADTGTVADEALAVRARRTVTFALPKPGLLVLPGASYCGRLTVAQIGLPRSLFETDPEIDIELTTLDWMRESLPERSESRDANKGTFGTVLVIAGSAGMAGAASLTALSALRAGAGLVMLAVPESVLDMAAALAPEAVLKPLPETPERTHGGPGALEAALALAEKADAVALGPGMSGNTATVSFVQAFVRQAACPLVVDADGLNALAQTKPPIRDRSDLPLVLTPHPGEMGRLLGMKTHAVQADRMTSVRQCARDYNAVALLKGSRTLVADSAGRVAINRSGSVALATAGSGDVLTGVIGALLGQKMAGMNAGRAGAYLHALAGEIAAREVGKAGTLAGDVRDRIPRARAMLYEDGGGDTNEL